MSRQQVTKSAADGNPDGSERMPETRNLERNDCGGNVNRKQVCLGETNRIQRAIETH